MIIIIGLIIIYIGLVILQSIICKQNKFALYIGLPGTGKSTIASYIATRDKKKKKKEHVLSNFFIRGIEELDPKVIGHVDIQNSTIIIDEAGMDYDNRNWKTNLDKENIYYYKHHRHYNTDIYLLSQTFDIDCKLLNLVNEIRVVKKSLIPFFITTKAIKKKIDINKETGEIIEKFQWVLFSSKRYFMPKQWKYFNSFTRKELEKIKFKVYGDEEIELL